jgi:hypothetical protein
MQVTGSFKIPQFDVSRNVSLKGGGHVPRETRAEAKAIFLSAVRDYLVAVLERIPVLSGTTKIQFAELLEQVEDLLLANTSELAWRAEGEYDPVGIDTSSSNVSLEPTGRQHTGSPGPPDSSPDREYKTGTTYHGRRVYSRQQWREVESSYVEGANTLLYSINRGGWYQNIDFLVEVFDIGKDYYPEVYATLEAVGPVFEESLNAYYDEFLMNSLNFYINRVNVRS